MISIGILIASIFLLTAFAVERFDRRSGVPSVIVMIAIGLLAQPLLRPTSLVAAALKTMVPIAGAIGLVLIVLEGSLDIELRRERIKLVAKASILAVGAFVLCLSALAEITHYALHMDEFDAMVLATPFAVISSAIAIPASHFLEDSAREFIIYESSVSDIFGVLVFIALLNSGGTISGFLTGLAGGGILSLILAFVCSLALVLVSTRTDAHVRYVPLLAGLFALYAAGDLLHLSPLIMVLLFGLMLNNKQALDRLPGLRGVSDRIAPATVGEFKVLVQELTFAVRGFFFFLLGYSTKLVSFTEWRSWAVAAAVLVIAYGLRYSLLRLIEPRFTSSLAWMAPRGLVTVVLYLDAEQRLALPAYLNATVRLVVILSAMILALSRRAEPRGVARTSIS
ncbi:MAG: cation:proton antiporter [Gammaproteobacteria bacterium]|nr:cation:proton antiporter [Gammaproteobacteria bacterium]